MAEIEDFKPVDQQGIYSLERINAINKVKEEFKMLYGSQAEFGVRAPGMYHQVSS